MVKLFPKKEAISTVLEQLIKINVERESSYIYYFNDTLIYTINRLVLPYEVFQLKQKMLKVLQVLNIL